MSKIISIGTAVPERHNQQDILRFMNRIYGFTEGERRKLAFLYRAAGIDARHSVVPDYSLEPDAWTFYPATENLEPFPSLEQRMKWYNEAAPQLSMAAIERAVPQKDSLQSITHLITVSCTGMSAPGLDLQLMERLGLPAHVFRTSVNFMGCYAAIHGLKIADLICRAEPEARVIVVATELCTLHFQREATPDNIAASLLFADGAAAALVVPDGVAGAGVRLVDFYSEVASQGKKDMAWELSSTGFRMTLSQYVPERIGEDLGHLLTRALDRHGLQASDIGGWCMHPGGKKILEAIEKSLSLPTPALRDSYDIMREYGNMSSPTILFVLDRMMRGGQLRPSSHLFGAAFGPGLTMESFLATTA